ncbi:hypothetical protein DRN76_02080 [Methanosarcinales archaeon]|nr:MAG: hypothetical protein DRN76_02080 [Methanosarcinales archaeon]
MKKKTMVGLIAIIAIVAVVIFAGCVEEKAPTSTQTSTMPTYTPELTPTPEPTPIPTPKFKRGDVVTLEDVYKINHLDIGDAIIQYDKDSDEYIEIGADKLYRDEWNLWTEIGKSNTSRSYIDSYYIKIGHTSEVDKRGDFSDVPFYKPSEGDKETTLSYGVYVEVSYMGDWSGSYGGIGSSKSVDGWGTEEFYISSGDDIVSACFQKMEDDHTMLTVRIIKNGEVVKSESTTAAYGVVCVSASV